MSIRAFGDDTMYVSFPANPRHDGSYLIPPEVNEWLRVHNIDDWGIVKGIKSGVFLSGEDAVAFRLRFSV